MTIRHAKSHTVDETITPKLAAEYLALSVGNRTIRPDVVAILATAMAHGQFLYNADPIRFDTEGHLIDGHHRLTACVLANVPFTTAVARGLDPEVRTTIDIGLKRTLADHLKMRGELNTVNAAAYLVTAAKLVAGITIKMSTTDIYDEWLSVFAEGHKFALDSIVNCRFMRNAPIAGAFVVAYKANPDKVADFAVRVRDGDRLSKGEPAFVLRDYLMLYTGRAPGGRAFKQTTMDTSRKVLTAIYSELHGQRRTKLQGSLEAHEWFRGLYARGTGAKLAKEAVAIRQNARTVVGDVEQKISAQEEAERKAS